MSIWKHDEFLPNDSNKTLITSAMDFSGSFSSWYHMYPPDHHVDLSCCYYRKDRYDYETPFELSLSDENKVELHQPFIEEFKEYGTFSQQELELEGKSRYNNTTLSICPNCGWWIAAEAEYVVMPSKHYQEWGLVLKA